MMQAYMGRTSLSVLAVAAFLSAGTTSQPAQAGGRDFAIGVITGAVGAAIANQAGKQRAQPRRAAKKKYTKKRAPKRTQTRRTASKPAAPRPTIATYVTSREEVRDFQTRLNTLGFDAGAPDGLVGKRTRGAVRAFQTSLGVEATGTLTETQVAVLKQQSSQPLMVGVPGAMPGAAGQAFPIAAGRLPAQMPAPAFPLAIASGAGLGAGLGASAGAAAFPALPGAGAPQAGPQGFAASLGGDAPAPAAPSFPVVALPGGAPAQAQPAFPALPTTATAAVQRPGATDGAFQSAALPTTASGSALPIAQPAAQPMAAGPVLPIAVPPSAGAFDVLGVTVENTLAEAEETLLAAGFDGCETKDAIMTCAMDKESLSDRVILGSLSGVPEAGSYLIARELSFAKPVPADFLEARMAESYGPLLSLPGQVSASQGCRDIVNALDSDGLSSRAFMESGDDAIVELAGDCPSYASIRFIEDAESDFVEGVAIILFHGDGVLTATRDTAAAAATEAVDNVLKF